MWSLWQVTVGPESQGAASLESQDSHARMGLRDQLCQHLQLTSPKRALKSSPTPTRCIKHAQSWCWDIY